MLKEKGWEGDEARRVQQRHQCNMLIDETKGVQFLHESMDSIGSGFDDVIRNGVLLLMKQ